MSSFPFYRMPPLPAKRELLKQLLSEPHTAELFLGETGNPVLAVISTERLSESDSRLFQAILRLIAQASADHLSKASILLIHSSQPTPSVYQVQPDVWVDLEQYEVRCGQQRLPLRAREAELLRLLLRNPRRYISADVLADAIGAVGTEETEHPVEEMIYQLRRKLGEPLHHPQLIRCKRHAGYAIFPVEGIASLPPDAS